MEETIFKIKDLDLYYGEKQALKKVTMDINKNRVTAFIGPSGCGKSTFLRLFNRMNDLIEGCRITGQVLLKAAGLRAVSRLMIQILIRAR